jgi:predicted amidohydrolase
MKMTAVAITLFVCLFSNPASADAHGAGGEALIAAYQMPSDKAGNFDGMMAAAMMASQSGAKLIIFPESSVFGWLNPQAFYGADKIPGTYAEMFQKIAVSAGIWVAAGIAEQAYPSRIPSGAYHVYDSGLLINKKGVIKIRHRKVSVLKNAFDPAACKKAFGTDSCEYAAGTASDITVVDTPFGRTGILVCADAYTYDPTALKAMKALKPDFVIIPWGVGAAKSSECGQSGFNATEYAAAAAKYIGTAWVAGGNAVGNRPYGRFRPAVYCGYSGYSSPDGQTTGGSTSDTPGLVYFKLPLGAKSKMKEKVAQ